MVAATSFFVMESQSVSFTSLNVGVLLTLVAAVEEVELRSISIVANAASRVATRICNLDLRPEDISMLEEDLSSLGR